MVDEVNVLNCSQRSYGVPVFRLDLAVFHQDLFVECKLTVDSYIYFFGVVLCCCDATRLDPQSSERGGREACVGVGRVRSRHLGRIAEAAEGKVESAGSLPTSSDHR